MTAHESVDYRRGVGTKMCVRCPKRPVARGLCRVHYSKLLRTGVLEPLMVDATPTHRQVKRLLATGSWTRASIARATGVHVDTVSQLAAGRRHRVLETVAAAIAAVRPQQET
jgi:hypothetical protein